MGFFNRKKEQYIDLDGYIIDINQFLLMKVPTNLSTYNIPSTVKEISMSALNNMKQSAVEIDFSKNTNITILPFGSFSGFKKLSKVILPPSLKKMDYFFDGNALNNGVEIVLPKDLEQFALNQFSPSTLRLELDDSVTTIKGGIVSHNNVLEELIISGNVKSLAKYSVNQVKFLKRLWLKDGIISMDDEAIRGCNNLIEVHIPDSLKKFKLGSDDFRPVKDFAFSGKKYSPTPEEIEKEQNRIIKIYKILDGKEIILEVKRRQFKSITDTGRELIFEGQDNSQYRIQKEEIINYEYVSIDIVTKKYLIQDRNRPISNQQSNATAFSDNNSQQKNIDTNISSKTNKIDTKSKIEKLLGLPISSTKKVRDNVTGVFKTILKTKQELSEDMVSLLEELEEDCVVEQLDNKTRNEYKRYLQTIYRELISKAPFEPIDVENKISFQEQESRQETTSNRNPFIHDNNLIKQVLGIPFENYNYIIGTNNSEKQLVLKSKQQLQMEYLKLIRRLNEKMDTGELSDTQYNTMFSTITNLYHTYLNELNQQAKTVSKNQEFSDQEPQQYSQPETIDKVDEIKGVHRK